MQNSYTNKIVLVTGGTSVSEKLRRWPLQKRARKSSSPAAVKRKARMSPRRSPRRGARQPLSAQTSPRMPTSRRLSTSSYPPMAVSMSPSTMPASKSPVRSIKSPKNNMAGPDAEAEPRQRRTSRRLRVGQSARMVPSIQQPSKDCESEVPTAAEPASATVSTCSSSENRDAISLNLASDPTSSMTTSFPMTQPESITLDIKRALRPQSDLSQLDCTNDLHLSFLDQIRNPFLARDSRLAHSMLKPGWASM